MHGNFRTVTTVFQLGSFGDYRFLSTFLDKRKTSPDLRCHTSFSESPGFQIFHRIGVWMHIMYIFRFCAKWVLLDLYYILVPLFFYLSIRLKHLNISQRHKSISISMLQCCHSVFRFFICYTVCLETVFMI